MAQEGNLPAAATSAEVGNHQLALPGQAAQRRRLRALLVQMVVGLVAALLLVVAFAQLVNLNSVVRRLEHLSVTAALLSGVIFLSAYVVRALRWRYLLTPRHTSVGRVTAIYQVATFVNLLLPVRGGELVKGVLLRRFDDIPMSESLPTVTMDKTMDLLPAVVLLTLLPFLDLQLSQPLWVLLLLVLLFLLGGVLFLGFAVWQRRMATAVLSWLMRRLPDTLRQRIEPFALRFVDALLALVAQPRLLIVASGYTAIAVCLDALACFFEFHAIGSVVAFPVVLYGYTLYNLIYILPSPPGNIGSAEITMMLVFGDLLHVNRSSVAAMLLFGHPFTSVLVVISGLICLSLMGLSPRATLSLTQAPTMGHPTPSRWTPWRILAKRGRPW
jgi:uncharacterized protein (TIRG00374 family)